MSALRITLARGGPLMLCIHAMTAVCAIGTVGPLHDALASALTAHGAGPELTAGDLALVLELTARHWRPLLRAAWPWLLASVLLAPALTLSLVHALTTDAGALRSLRAGATRFLAAIATRAVCVLLFATGAAILTGVLALALSATPPLLELPIQCAYLALLALHALGCATFHDLAFARLALRRTPLARALLAAALRTSPHLLALRGAAAAATLALTVLADLASRVVWPVPGALRPALATALAQALLFAALTCRALFLQRILLRQPLSLSPPRP